MGIKLKRSAVASKVPVTTDLELGELGINTYDGKLFLKKNVSGVETIVEVGPVLSVAGRTGAVTLARADVGLGSVDNTSDAGKPVSTATQTALNGKANAAHTHAISDVTSLQTALDGKAAASHSHSASQISDSTAAGRALLTAADAAAQRASLGLGTGALRNVSVGTSAPASPAVNDLWVDTN